MNRPDDWIEKRYQRETDVQPGATSAHSKLVSGDEERTLRHLVAETGKWAVNALRYCLVISGRSERSNKNEREERERNARNNCPEDEGTVRSVGLRLERHGALGFGLWTLGFGLWALDFGLWALDFGLWTLRFGFWVLGFGF